MKRKISKLNRGVRSRTTELSTLLSKIIKDNSKLSQRALAKRISVSSGYISQVLKGEKIPSEKVLIKIGEALKLRESTTSRMLAAAQRDRCGDSDVATTIPSSIRLASRMPIDIKVVDLNYRKRTSESSQAFMAEYELPIAIAALGLDGGPRDINWFSKIMGVDPSRAEKMIMILAELGMAKIAKDSAGNLLIENSIPDPKTSNQTSALQHRALMKSFLGLVHDSLSAQNADLPLRGMAVPLNSSKISELNAIFNEAFFKVLALSVEPGPKDKLYCIQFATIDWDSAKKYVRN